MWGISLTEKEKSEARWMVLGKLEQVKQIADNASCKEDRMLAFAMQEAFENIWKILMEGSLDEN